MSEPFPKTEIKNGKTIHFSVGALIEKDSKYLLIDRATPPLGFAGLAGHIDEGEEPLQALKREVWEESGLSVTASDLLFEEFLEWNWCGVGVEGHYWYFYKCKVDGEIKFNAEETKKIGWYSLEEIRELKLEPVWKYWFERLKIL